MIKLHYFPFQKDPVLLKNLFSENKTEAINYRKNNDLLAYPEEFLNSSVTRGMPLHILKIKEERLKGFCYGIRLLIKRIQNHYIYLPFIFKRNE